MVTVPSGSVFPAPVPAAVVSAVFVGRQPTLQWVTLALDECELTGPRVDEALGVEEPMVDRWEAGVIPLELEDVGRLATLTGRDPAWFFEPPLPASGFVCGRGRGRGCAPIVGGVVLSR